MQRLVIARSRKGPWQSALLRKKTDWHAGLRRDVVIAPYGSE